MTQTNKRAVLTLIIWGLVLLSFVLIFFLIGDGPAGFAGDRARFVAVAVIFILGYLFYFGMLYLTRERPGKRPVQVDERDVLIISKASGSALMGVLAYVYLVCILLHLSYEGVGVMPVGWMWFLGYSSIFMGYIIHASATLLSSHRMSAYGES